MVPMAKPNHIPLLRSEQGCRLLQVELELKVVQSEQVLETGRRLMVSSSQVRISRSSRRMDSDATRPVLSHTNLGHPHCQPY